MGCEIKWVGATESTSIHILVFNSYVLLTQGCSNKINVLKKASLHSSCSAFVTKNTCEGVKF